jgi:hypothetical protein
MRRNSRLGIAILSALVLAAAFASETFAQSGAGEVTGGSRLVVSRASDPAPVPATTSVYQAVSARYWEMIAFANARLTALSFAPARGAYASRTGAVRRRAIP